MVKVFLSSCECIPGWNLILGKRPYWQILSLTFIDDTISFQYSGNRLSNPILDTVLIVCHGIAY